MKLKLARLTFMALTAFCAALATHSIIQHYNSILSAAAVGATVLSGFAATLFMKS